MRFARTARCVRVVPHHLGKGTRWRVPVASPRRMARFGIEPSPRQSTVSPVDHSQARLRSPCTHRHRGVSPPLRTHSPELETSLSTGTGPWRNVRRSIALGVASVLPEAPWPTVRRLDAASNLAAGPRAGRFRSPRTRRKSAKVSHNAPGPISSSLFIPQFSPIFQMGTREYKHHADRDYDHP